MNLTPYLPGGRFVNLYMPKASVVVVATVAPASLISLTVTLAFPASPSSWRPFPFKSSHTLLPMVTGKYIPTSKFFTISFQVTFTTGEVPLG